MTDLHDWLAGHNNSLPTFRAFQRLTMEKARAEPGSAILYWSLSKMAGDFTARFDDGLLTADIADRAYASLLALTRSVETAGAGSFQARYEALNALAQAAASSSWWKDQTAAH